MSKKSSNFAPDFVTNGSFTKFIEFPKRSITRNTPHELQVRHAQNQHPCFTLHA